MRIRFLRTVPSMAPEYPFEAGQIVVLPKLTAEIRTWVKNGDAVILPDPPEAAALGPPPETAVESDARTRGSR